MKGGQARDLLCKFTVSSERSTRTRAAADILQRLYVEEKQTPAQIVKWFATHFNVAESEVPSARLFRRQFAEKWHFPPRTKRVSAEDEPVVVERMRQLWEQNLPVTQIRETLEDEGWELGNNEFRRIRKNHGIIRRGTLGAYDVKPKGTYSGKRKRENEQAAAEVEVTAGSSADALLALQQESTVGLTPEEAARRAERLAQLEIESEQQMVRAKHRSLGIETMAYHSIALT